MAINAQAHLASILIPVYNAERYIGETLNSALAQTHPNCEIIVIDDGSQDGSAEILRQYEGRIRWWSQQNAGQAVTRNRLLTASSGSYLEFLDADDILHPEKIATQIRAIEAHPGAGLCLGSMRLFHKDADQEVGEFYPSPIGVDPWLALITLQYPFTSAGLWRRTFLESLEGWQEGIVSGHEYNRYFAVLKSGAPIIFTTEAHTWYRMPSLEKPNPRSRLTTLNERLTELRAIESHLIAARIVTPRLRRALAEQRLDIARKMWPVDQQASIALANSIPAGHIGMRSSLQNLPARFLLLFKVVGFEVAQRLTSVKKLVGI